MSFLIYGAYGYTGALIAREAKRRGLTPTLAGRDGGKLAALARELDLPSRPFALDDRAALDAALGDAPLVLHCAGPFSKTTRPMLEGCLRTGTHYLDITGEIGVFEMLAAQDVRARQAEVLLLPGVGFDVVPTDCLAAHLKSRLPEAAYLELAIQGMSGVSRGTALTAVENMDAGGAVRRGGQITRVPGAWRTRTVDFGGGPVEVVSIPWGDVATAYHTTDIPNIVTYARLPGAAVRAMKAGNYLGWLFSSSPVQRLLKRQIRQRPPGPDAQVRARGASVVWGQASTATSAQTVASRLRGPEAYELTVQTALAAAQKVMEGAARPGFQTPAGLFGKDFILEIDGVEREDVA